MLQADHFNHNQLVECWFMCIFTELSKTADKEQGLHSKTAGQVDP